MILLPLHRLGIPQIYLGRSVRHLSQLQKLHASRRTPKKRVKKLPSMPPTTVEVLPTQNVDMACTLALYVLLKCMAITTPTQIHYEWH